jgi:hypothetical protein
VDFSLSEAGIIDDTADRGVASLKAKKHIMDGPPMLSITIPKAHWFEEAKAKRWNKEIDQPAVLGQCM